MAALVDGMTDLTPEQERELARFPEPLRALIYAELRAGNTLDELGHSHPAPPVGAYVRLGRPVRTRPRESGQGLSFYERSGSLYAGEFTDAQRYFFVLEPPLPPAPPPDMDAIRAAHAPAPFVQDTPRPDDRYVPPGAVAPEPAPDLDTVEGVKRAIVLGMKRGGTYSTAHKEGGTRISHRSGKYVRDDYGDSPALYELHDDAAFLAMLFAYFRHEVSRGQTAPSELDVWRRILERMERPGAASALVPSAAAHAEVTKRLSRLHAAFAVTVALLVGLAVASYRFITIPSTGLPLGAALRTPSHVFQLIHTVERRLPSLHRAPGSDRFRIDLLAVDLNDPTRSDTLPLLRDQGANAITPITKMLGVEGDVVWVQALDTFAVNLRTKDVARTEDLVEKNPELQLFLASARPDFTDRFVMVAPDYSYAYAFDPDTLKATMVRAPKRDTWLAEQRAGRLEASLCSGGLLTDQRWIAIATEEYARSDLSVGATLPRDFPPSDHDERRMLYAGTTDGTAPRPRVAESAPRSGAVYRDGVFLRASAGAGLLRAAAPDSLFMLHRPGAEPFAALSLSRLTAEGKALWSVDTGVGRLQQVLPGAGDVVLIGERTPLPNRAPEPILVRVTLADGALGTLSLWR
jgi:hypothetical protein